jgi:hypothetical protein
MKAQVFFSRYGGQTSGLESPSRSLFMGLAAQPELSSTVKGALEFLPDD